MKLLTLFAAIFAVSASAYAAGDKNPSGTDGCGLGWQVTQKKTMLATVTRATTNAVVPPTFGMTTGTIGCDQHSIAKREVPALNMVATNQDALLIDIAAGGGENLAALAQAMGCSNSAGLAQQAQANYASLASGNSIQLYKGVRAIAVANGCSI